MMLEQTFKHLMQFYNTNYTKQKVLVFLLSFGYLVHFHSM